VSEPIRQLRPAQVPSIVEGTLLGCVLELCDQAPATSASTAKDLLEVSGLTPDDLRDVKVRSAWRVVSYLAEHGKFTTIATVHSAGKNPPFGMFCEADRDWLASLAAANTLSRESFAQVAGDLRRGVLGRAIAERLESTARDLRNGNFNAASVAAELDQASNALARSDVQGQTAASDVVEQAENWERRERTGTTPGILTRIKLLDQVTTPHNGIGGFPPKFGVLVGQPGVGKNILLAGMIKAQLLAEPELVVGLFALEDGSKWLLKRWTALDLGLPVGAVGSVRLTEDQRSLLRSLEPEYHRLLSRVQVYRYRRIRAPDMIHLSRVWIHHFGVREILFDNLTHLDTRPAPFGGNFRRQWINEKRNEAVAEATEGFAELADRREIPIIAAAHTTRPDSERDEHRPPRLAEIAESSGIGKVCRFAFGLWKTKGRALRGTVLKNTEGPGTGETIELEAHVEAAMLDVDGGRLVNLEQEAREEKASREASKESAIVMNGEKRRLERLRVRGELVAALPKPAEVKPPQLDLLEAKP
jgi:replicative DNA helicase